MMLANDSSREPTDTLKKPLMEHSLILIILGAAAAGFVQGLSGTAFSMVALPFWV
jgi:hypothetical protein